MSKKIITTDEIIIKNPHVALVKLGEQYPHTDVKLMSKIRNSLYKYAEKTAGVSCIINGSNHTYIYVYFEKEDDLLYFMLTFHGHLAKVSVWKYADQYTFYCVSE